MNKMITLVVKLCICVIVISIGAIMGIDNPLSYVTVAAGFSAGVYFVCDKKSYPRS